MQKAKSAVSDFLSKDGKHDTTVHETVNDAVQHEHVKKTQAEEATAAVDREVHQDHYHTKVQPVHDKEVLPEQHHHRVADTRHEEFDHRDGSQIKQRLEAEAAQFKHTREVGETQHTKATAPTAVGEHVHHHIHEKIQPVIEKETIQPSVVHTTVPVHEVHHNEAKHHSATALPPVTMGEFRAQGNSLEGRQERTDSFEGPPKSHEGGVIGGHKAAGTTSLTSKHDPSGTTHNTGTHQHTGTTHNTGTHQHTGTTHGTTADTLSGNGTSGTARTGKPSLLDKLNPKKDTDGDGKAGIMD